MRARLLTSTTSSWCAVLTAVALGVIYLRYQALSFAWEAEQLLIRETGVLAFVLFGASLMCTPLKRLSQRLGRSIPNLLPWRRSLGLASAGVAIVHMLISYRLHIADAPIFGAWFQPYAQAGTAALILMVALVMTSFPKLNQRLKFRHWKTLHRVVFVIFFLLLLHIILGPHLPSGYILALLAILATVSWTGRLNP